MEITAAPSDILAYAARMNLGEYYLKKMKKEDASLNLGEYHQEKDNFDLALDAFNDALSFARQRDFDTRPTLCSLGDLLMDSELFDGLFVNTRKPRMQMSRVYQMQVNFPKN